MDDTKTFDEKLVELIEANRLLYDLKSNGHGNALAREKAWHNIATTLRKSVKDCKRRYVTLRERYVKQKRLYDRANSEGGTPPAPWHLYHAMSFLAPFCKKRNRSQYINSSMDFGHLSKLRLIDSSEVPAFEEMAKSIANNGVVEVTMEDCNSQNVTLERDFRLIELVKCHRVLYETAKAPVKAELRILAWRQIAKLMNMEWKKCRTRWISLRERFVREYRRELQCKGSITIHKPWYLYQALTFLKEHVKLRINPLTNAVEEEGDDGSENMHTRSAKSVEADDSANGFYSGSEDNNDEFLENDIIEEVDDPLSEENDEKCKTEASLDATSAKGSIEIFELEGQNETDSEERVSVVKKPSPKIASRRLATKRTFDESEDEISGFLTVIGRKLKTLEGQYKNKAMEDLLQYCNALQNFQKHGSNKLPAVVMSCTSCDMRHQTSSGSCSGPDRSQRRTHKF